MSEEIVPPFDSGLPVPDGYVFDREHDRLRIADDPPDCADLLGCPCCGGTRVERFTVDRFIVFACADCGTYDTETTRDKH